MTYKKLRTGRVSTVSMTYERIGQLPAQGGHRPSKSANEGLYHQENFEQRQRMRRQIVQELVEKNFDEATSRFVTLTFSADCLPQTIDHRPFKNFIKRIQYRYHHFRYVAVMEISSNEKSARWHYHMICNLPQIDHSILLSLWKCGPVNVQCVYDLEKLTRYITKQFSQYQPALKGKKAYFFSRGLMRHKVTRSWVKQENQDCLIKQQELQQLKPIYLFNGENDYIGHFTYEKYKHLQPKYPVAGFAVKNSLSPLIYFQPCESGEKYFSHHRMFNRKKNTLHRLRRPHRRFSCLMSPIPAVHALVWRIVTHFRLTCLVLILKCLRDFLRGPL